MARQIDIKPRNASFHSLFVLIVANMVCRNNVRVLLNGPSLRCTV